MTITAYPPVSVSDGPVTLGYGAITSGPTIAATEVDIPGTTVTVAVAAGRRIKITGRVHTQSPSTVNNELVIWVSEDGVHRAHSVKRVINVGDAMDFHVEYVSSPTAGTHTYKLSGQVSVGAGNFSVATASDRIGFILVEDVTGQALPVLPQSVPVGVLARAEYVAAGTTAMSSGAWDIPSLSVNVNVTDGRVLRISHFSCSSNTGTYSETRILRNGVSLNRSYFGHSANEIVTHDWSVIDSPAAGSHTYKVQMNNAAAGTLYADGTNECYIIVEDITATPAPAGTAPSSTLGYAQSTTATNVTAGPTDVTALSVTVTVPEGRRLRINVDLPHFWYSDGTTTHGIWIYKNGVSWALAGWTPRVPVSESGTLSSFVMDTPTAGTHTYKVVATRSSGSGTITIHGSASAVQSLLVEDVTGTSLAHNHDSSPSSTLAYVENTTTGLTNITGAVQDVPGLTATVTVPAARRLKVTALALGRGDVGTTMQFEIADGANNRLQAGKFFNGVAKATDQQTMRTEYVFTVPSAGSYTFKARFGYGAGTGSVDLIAGASYPAFLLVEDITGTGLTGHTHTEFDDTGWIAPALLSGWANYGSGWTVARYRKRAGIVYMQGLIANGTSGAAVFYLPAGFRPHANDITMYTSVSGEPWTVTRVDIRGWDGAVMVTRPGNTWATITCSFPADA